MQDAANALVDKGSMPHIKSFSPLTDAVTPLLMRYGHGRTVATEARQCRVALMAWLLRGMHGRYLPGRMKAAFGLATDKRCRDRTKLLVPHKAFVADVSEARAALMQDHRSAELKLMALRLLINRIEAPREVRLAMGKAGFTSHEANAYCDLLRDPELWDGVKTSIGVLGNTDVLNDLVLSPLALREQAGQDIERYGLNRTAGAVVRRKLRFVTQTGVVGAEDLQSDLMVRATAWYNYVRPLVPRLHAVNYARTAITSGVQDLITYWTDEDRARLVETSNGWESRVITLPGMIENLADPAASSKEEADIADSATRSAMKEYDFGGEIIWRGKAAKRAAKARAQAGTQEARAH